jgi:hypothetical protein
MTDDPQGNPRPKEDQMAPQLQALDDTQEELIERVRAASRRLDVVLDQLRGGGRLDPALLRHVVETINGGVLETAEAYQRMLEQQWRETGLACACSTACWASDLHCPTSEPLLPIAGELRAAGFEPYHDEVEERVARETRCICGEAMTYLGLQRGPQIKAWAVCTGCGHWLPL